MTAAKEETRPNLTHADLRARREELNVSRAALAELTGLSLSRVWAAEQEGKTVSDEHRSLIVAALENVSKNGLPEHLRPRSKTQTAAQRLAEVKNLLDGADEAKTLKDLRALVDRVRAAVLGGEEAAR